MASPTFLGPPAARITSPISIWQCEHVSHISVKFVREQGAHIASSRRAQFSHGKHVQNQ